MRRVLRLQYYRDRGPRNIAVILLITADVPEEKKRRAKAISLSLSFSMLTFQKCMCSLSCRLLELVPPAQAPGGGNSAVLVWEARASPGNTGARRQRERGSGGVTMPAAASVGSCRSYHGDAVSIGTTGAGSSVFLPKSHDGAHPNHHQGRTSGWSSTYLWSN